MTMDDGKDQDDHVHHPAQTETQPSHHHARLSQLDVLAGAPSLLGPLARPDGNEAGDEQAAQKAESGRGRCLVGQTEPDKPGVTSRRSSTWSPARKTTARRSE